MAAPVRYSETLHLQPSTFLELGGVLALAFAPLTVFTWLTVRPLVAALVAGVAVALLATVWTARWQFQVRSDGLYYRLVPFVPVWRSIVTTAEITAVTTDHDANGRDVLDDEGALFPWSSGNRTIVMAVQGGVRIERADGGDVFVSSRSPDAFASAMRAVAT